MDYSLLVNVEAKKDAGTDMQDTRNTFESVDGTEIYHFGIIDYLQTYNLDKKCETWFKRRFLGAADEQSSVEPNLYGERFSNFMRDEVFNVPVGAEEVRELERVTFRY